MIPAIGLFLGRIPPWAWRGLAIVAAFGALWIWHAGKVDAAYDKGVADTDAGWQEEASRLRAVAAQEALQRQGAVNAANDAATRSQASLDALAVQSKVTHETYYRNRPIVRCLDPERVRAIKEADRAASAAAAAK